MCVKNKIEFSVTLRNYNLHNWNNFRYLEVTSELYSSGNNLSKVSYFYKKKNVFHLILKYCCTLFKSFWTSCVLNFDRIVFNRCLVSCWREREMGEMQWDIKGKGSIIQVQWNFIFFWIIFFRLYHKEFIIQSYSKLNEISRFCLRLFH